MSAFPDTLLSARDAITRRAVSAVELTRQMLDRIAKLDPVILAFNSTYPDRAIEQAKQVDDGQATGPLAGVPIAVKDNLCTSFGTTTCSSKMLREFPSPVRRHGRQAPGSRGRGHPGQDQSRRVRHGQLNRKQRL